MELLEAPDTKSFSIYRTKCTINIVTNRSLHFNVGVTAVVEIIKLPIRSCEFV